MNFGEGFASLKGKIGNFFEIKPQEPKKNKQNSPYLGNEYLDKGPKVGAEKIAQHIFEVYFPNDEYYAIKKGLKILAQKGKKEAVFGEATGVDAVKRAMTLCPLNFEQTNYQEVLINLNNKEKVKKEDTDVPDVANMQEYRNKRTG